MGMDVKHPTLDIDSDCSIHHTLTGQIIDYVATNGTILLLRTTTGKELQVAWVDDNGNPIKGKPAIRFSGTHVLALPARLGTRINNGVK